MASRWGADLACGGCGLRYQDLRTGDTFASIKAEMLTGDPDPAAWRYRRRNGVLGYWHARKLLFWDMHLGQCACAQVAA